nr:DJ-1/PfpI family protein [Bacteroidota bacterium]
MKTLITLLIVTLFFCDFHAIGQPVKSNANLKVLAVTPNKLGANFNFYIDNMESYGWDVTWAGLTETVNTCSWSNPFGHFAVDVDTLIQDIEDVTYWDVIALMPATWWSGNAYGDLLNSLETLDLLIQANENNMVIFGTCAGVRVLAAADLLNGVNVTGRDEYASEYIASGANYLGTFILPVIDGNFVTSTKGMYYHYQNIEAILTALAGLDSKNGCKELPVTLKENNQLPVKNDLVWSKTFGGEDSEGAYSVIQTSDGGFMICGYLNMPDYNSTLMMIKTDNDGNEQWSYAFGGEGWECGKSVCETMSGDFVVTGYATSTGAGLQDVLVVKVNASGQQVWNKTFGGPGLDIGFSICETSD